MTPMWVATKLLEKARRGYVSLEGSGKKYKGLPIDFTGQAASDLIKEALQGPSACMVSRFGSNEATALLQHIDINLDQSNVLKKAIRYIRGDIGPFWWQESTIKSMAQNAGFFPSDDATLTRFAKGMLSDIKEINILGTWQIQESRLADILYRATIVPLQDLEPFVHQNPWSTALEGKTVLVVHPFEETIRAQYQNRKLLFSDQRTLPAFNLKTLKAVQSIGGSHSQFSSWFEAMDWMCEQISRTSFDIALIGAGAYGLPLAAHVKRLGKKAIHLGGATQLLFGIKGKRWEQWSFYRDLFNDYWIRPLPVDTPKCYQDIETGCYW